MFEIVRKIKHTINCEIHFLAVKLEYSILNQPFMVKLDSYFVSFFCLKIDYINRKIISLFHSLCHLPKSA